jgi:alkaline phosphatase
MKLRLFHIFLALISTVTAQEKKYTAEQAHSHNDYEQKQPFHLAYQERFGSMEADIHLVNGKLYVSHDEKDIQETKTIQYLYLDPIAAQIDNITNLQLLIDIKTDAISTLDELIKQLYRYPTIINSKKVRFVISGNRPPAESWMNYPQFIYFDGRLGISYSNEQLKKVGLISESYLKFISEKKYWPLQPADKEKIKQAIKSGHDLGKPVRLWAHPDFPEAWEEMISLELDFINTDKINELSDFLTARNKNLRLLPYNRIISSAGEVIRYGKPELEF